jgi:hypothetical protein
MDLSTRLAALQEEQRRVVYYSHLTPQLFVEKRIEELTRQQIRKKSELRHKQFKSELLDELSVYA